jgi:hypothetical protein
VYFFQGRVARVSAIQRAQLPWKIHQLERLALDVGLETSGGGSHCPDLLSDRVWAHLEHSSIRAELLRASVFTWSVALFSWRVWHSDLLGTGLHYLSSLLRLLLYWREHFVAARIYCLYDHLRFMPDRPSLY